jgi:hypothetical protein
MAIFIKNAKLDSKNIYTWGGGTEILAFFDNNIISNFNNGEKPCFNQYSTKNCIVSPTDKNLELILKDKPDIIIADYNQMVKYKLCIDGYHIASVFPGGMIWKNWARTFFTFIIYEKD